MLLLISLCLGENQILVSWQRQAETSEEPHPPLGVNREPHSGYQGRVSGEIGIQ